MGDMRDSTGADHADSRRCLPRCRDKGDAGVTTGRYSRTRHLRRFTDDQIREIRLLLKDHSRHAVSKMFECWPGTIANIYHGATYKDVK